MTKTQLLVRIKESATLMAQITAVIAPSLGRVKIVQKVSEWFFLIIYIYNHAQHTASVPGRYLVIVIRNH